MVSKDGPTRTCRLDAVDVPLGMNDTLGNPLSIEMADQVDQVKVLQEERSVTDPLCLVRVRHGNTVRGGIDTLGGFGMTILFISRKVGMSGGALAFAVRELVDVGRGGGSVVAHCL